MSRHTSQELRRHLHAFMESEGISREGARFYSHVLPSPQKQTLSSRRVVGKNWALVGDAGYHRDAVTAHGISDAFRDAELLAVAVDQALGAGAEETAALALYQRQRDQALREIFEITCRLAAYPAVPAFIKLQKQLSAAIDSEAAALASWPVPGDRLLATA